MLREEINMLFNSNREELILYLSILTNKIINDYKIDAEKLSEEFGFELVFFNMDIEVKSYIKIYPDKATIGINDNLDEYDKNYYIFKETLFYFIYRYYIRLGFLDGKEGKIYHFLQAYWYRFLVDAKIYECEKLDIKIQEQGDLK